MGVTRAMGVKGERRHPPGAPRVIAAVHAMMMS